MSRAPEIERCLARGGLVLFGADTVYGLAWDPDSDAARERAYALKGRPPDKPSALMWFSRDAALGALTVGSRTHQALLRLLPAPVTLVVPDGVGLRVPVLAPHSPLAGLAVPVLQTSANLAGGAEARTLDDVPSSIRQGVDMVVDAGRLPGVASTVVDLRVYEEEGSWRVLRDGAVSRAALAECLDA